MISIESWKKMPAKAAIRYVLALLIMFCVLQQCSATVSADTNHPRGDAIIAVNADLTVPNNLDQVSIRIVDNTNQQILLTAANELASRLNATPRDETFHTGDPHFVKDKGIGLDLSLPVVPRGQGYLPIAPFIEALAPYAERVRIVYIIQGPFIYRGYQQYKRPDVSFTVDPPEVTPPDAPVPMAFYGVNITINNPSLTLQLPPYPTDSQKRQHKPLPLLAKLAFAGILGAVVSIILIKLLFRRRDPDETPESRGEPAADGQHISRELPGRKR